MTRKSQANKLLPLGKLLSLDEAIRRAREDGHTHDQVQAHQEKTRVISSRTAF